MKNGKFLSKVICLFILTFIILMSISFSKEKINIYSYLPYPEINKIINEHVDKYRQSNVLSLFDVNYYNLENIKDFDYVLKNNEIDIVIAPVGLRKLIEKYKQVRTWDEYFKKTPTFLAVFKTYTFDFMKNSSVINDSVEFLPFFAYSFYTSYSWPKIENLKLFEVLSYYNALINTTDYVIFYNKYLSAKTKVEGNLYPAIGTVLYDNARIFSINEDFVKMQSPVVLYGIFLTSSPNNISKLNAINFIATKIWDFETQIELCLNLGLLGADKNTTLHPGFVQKLKDKSFALYYNNQLGKIKEFNIDYDLFYNVSNMIIEGNDVSNIIGYLNSYLYSPLNSPDFLISNYKKTVGNSKSYFVAVFDSQNKIEKLIYSPDFDKKKYEIFDKLEKKKEKNKVVNYKKYTQKSVYDISFLILKEDKKLEDIKDYKISLKRNDWTIVLKKDKDKLILMKRRTPKYSVVVISE